MRVTGSNPVSRPIILPQTLKWFRESSKNAGGYYSGLVCKRLKQSDCKSGTTGFGGSNPSQPTMVPCRSGQTAQPAKLLYIVGSNPTGTSMVVWMVAREVIVSVANRRTRQNVVRGFDPLTIRLFGSLAQWLEQHSYKMEAAGSIPARPTTRNATVLRVFICHIPVFRYY